jgi:hypothetical protein
MTLLAYVNYCLETSSFNAFLEVYQRFCDNKIIKVDLRIKYFEYSVLAKDKAIFLAVYEYYKKYNQIGLTPVKKIISYAIKENLVTPADLE